MIDIIIEKIELAIVRMAAEHNIDKTRCQFKIYAETVVEDFDTVYNYKKQNGAWYVSYKPDYPGEKTVKGWVQLDSISSTVELLEKKYHSSDLVPKPKFDFVVDYNKVLEKNVPFLKIYNEPVDLTGIGTYVIMFIDNTQQALAREHNCQTTDLLVYIGFHPKKGELVLPVFVKGVQKGFISKEKLLGEEAAV